MAGTGTVHHPRPRFPADPLHSRILAQQRIRSPTTNVYNFQTLANQSSPHPAAHQAAAAPNLAAAAPELRSLFSLVATGGGLSAAANGAWTRRDDVSPQPCALAASEAAPHSSSRCRTPLRSESDCEELPHPKACARSTPLAPAW
jgi:hypothetical protein